MKKFILRTSLFIALVSLPVYGFLTLADGNTDPFYLRFTTPSQSSMILGTSRAAQGLQPRVLNKWLNGRQLFNYSFTVSHSPYGRVYLSSVKKKLSEKSQDGIFILAVDPWAISSMCVDPNEESEFRELKHCVGKTKFTNMNPNADYLLRSYEDRLFTIANKKTEMFLHNDGWLEISIDLSVVSEEIRVNRKVEIYEKDMVPFYKPSSIRVDYLEKTIAYLKKFGKVYLVRLPIHEKIMKLDDQLIPDFNEKMQSIAESHEVKYLDMTPMNSSFYYTDGNHLEKESGRKVSEIVGQWISQN